MHTARACTHTDMHSSVVRTHVHVWHFDKCTSDCLEVASTKIVRSCITSYIYTQFIPCHQDSIHFLHWDCLITFLWQRNWLSRTDPQTDTKIITSLQTAPSCTGSDWNRLWPSSSGRAPLGHSSSSISSSAGIFSQTFGRHSTGVVIGLKMSPETKPTQARVKVHAYHTRICSVHGHQELTHEQLRKSHHYYLQISLVCEEF